MWNLVRVCKFSRTSCTTWLDKGGSFKFWNGELLTGMLWPTNLFYEISVTSDFTSSLCTVQVASCATRYISMCTPQPLSFLNLTLPDIHTYNSAHIPLISPAKPKYLCTCTTPCKLRTLKSFTASWIKNLVGYSYLLTKYHVKISQGKKKNGFLFISHFVKGAFYM